MHPKITKHQDLIVWQKAMDLVVLIYDLTKEYPKNELYGLVSQMRRCAVSIPCNIAEGKRRDSRKDYRRFLTIAYGSGAELETQIEISKRLDYVTDKELKKISDLHTEVMKMLNTLIQKLESDPQNPPPATHHLPPKGFILLLSVLIVGAVALGIALSAVLLSTDSHRTSLAILQSNQARSLADACAEQALEAIRVDDGFTGTGNLTLGQGSCSYTVTDLGGENRNVESTGTVANVTRRVELNIDQISTMINISTWEEVDTF
jgi:four helix bundle protein